MFGSGSDKETYDPVVAGLKQSNDVTVRVLSAHKTPKQAEAALAGDYDLYVAGAGLASHLPGFIAAKVTKPVVGIPCPGKFGGLDALLSTLQMPPGIPVLTTGVSGKQAAQQISRMRDTQGVLTVVGGPANKYVEKAEAILKELGVSYQLSNACRAGCMNIQFVPLGEKTAEQDRMIIYVPIADETNPEDALKLLEMTQHGLWVGVNRADNAAIAAAQLQGNIAQVEAYREKIAAKVLEADKNEQ